MYKLKQEFSKVSKDFLEYITGADYYPSVVHTEDPTLVKYYIDFQWALDHNHFDYFDAQGIPVKKFINYGTQYNHTRIAAYALANWQRYIETQKDEYKKIFFTVLEWIIHNKSELHGGYTWFHNFDIGTVRAPWVSCMSHGEYMSILTRAYLYTGDEQYKTIAQKAAKTFLVPVERGGIQSTFPDGSVCFEEMPYIPHQHVLNGHLFGLIGLIDFCKLVDPSDREMNTLMEEAIQATKSNLQYYDTGFWSLYHYPVEDLPNPVTMYYHCVHLAQLQSMFYLTHDSFFSDYYIKWLEYSKCFLNRLRGMVMKQQYRNKYKARR